jgi:hypothetical protein
LGGLDRAIATEGPSLDSGAEKLFALGIYFFRLGLGFLAVPAKSRPPAYAAYRASSRSNILADRLLRKPFFSGMDLLLLFGRPISLQSVISLWVPTCNLFIGQ